MITKKNMVANNAVKRIYPNLRRQSLLGITLNSTSRKTVQVEERHKLIKLTLMTVFCHQSTRIVLESRTRMKTHKSSKRLEARRSRAKVEQSSRSTITGIGLRSK